MDLFQKCLDFTKADEVKQAGLYPYFHVLEANEGPVVYVEGRRFIMAGSNNYLGLTTHPRVKEAAKKAIDKYGTGCSGSRYLTGTVDLHNELEAKLAKFIGKEAVLLFSTGYQTALGTISTLVQRGEYVISDKENHASIINGCMMAKGGFAEFVRFKHNDMQDLEETLQRLPEGPGKLIVTDGIFSVTGEIANMPKMIEIAHKYGAKVLVDDAHSIGVIGKGGRGTSSYWGVTEETDLIMGTFSKTFASLGGFIAGPERVINYLKHNSPALIFSASPTPPSVASALEALNILEEQPELVDQLQNNVKYLRKRFKENGFKIIENESAIIPVIIGDMDKALIAWRKLFDKGVFVNTFVPPGVPPNMSMIRTSYMSTHRKEHLDEILEIFSEVWKDLDII
ncbi:MAG TPA: aminotransferase class I/II-fold pyridoxal phosphate-dependent enzyme [Candidatus Kapabacteria bacterium]|nr:aminotransferase class I/II-fold pyridoxal phosphate-dependent enzyme [Candidatus Kapabacteria bacterium]HOV91595.1 aminotransferase class I/II-fold pyridoxal phosphate-dependent enzyme [Candidatus Kapabacteria bacterium]